MAWSCGDMFGASRWASKKRLVVCSDRKVFVYVFGVVGASPHLVRAASLRQNGSGDLSGTAPYNLVREGTSSKHTPCLRSEYGISLCSWINCWTMSRSAIHG